MESNNNLKKRERERSKWQSIDHPKNMLETEIEEMWQLMMKQFKWRKIIAAGNMINQSLNLINEEKKMEQKIAEVQQQQKRKTFEQLQNKVWDPGRQDQKVHDQDIMNIFYFGSLMQEHSTQEKIFVISRHRGSCVLGKLVS